MREIVFDTETTGVDPDEGHRICEIGAVELLGQMPTGRTFHALINPCRDMPAEAARIHGHTNESLADKPVFAAIVKDFLEFIGTDTKLVAHNAMFDLGFVNRELTLCGHDPLPVERIVDTLAIAREKFPGKGHTLDALCNRFSIDLTRREKHGALLDSELLAGVYVELMGGRQRGMALGGPEEDQPGDRVYARAPVRDWPVRIFSPSEEEKERHRAFLSQLGDPLWAEVPGFRH
ncbi:DNA polymerase III subunit epsilon [Pacificimonas flava]|uniref:DNA polymerase III subunit epsilon n=2 Tax=Pacificimonas TaxID=1960290 RepID=A0A219B4G8_9SPHN|nr:MULTISPECIES: DNA polymerase III subunit epsilon [Pacificimonas]MBZ6377635.1 DNA polymerase III subunit epsilon [Pacificimonas aurantium]OWV32678.1 DNA polymerase III subunit epsilon [Pacificimonas flava]